MKQLFFISFVSLLFCISCKKVEETPTYKIQLKTNERFTVNPNKTWRDTIFYTIVGATEENYRFVFAEQKQSYSLTNSEYENIHQSIKIVQQTPTYLIYEIPYSVTSNYTFNKVTLYLTVNTEIIDKVELPIKEVTSLDDDDNTTSTSGTLIYLQENSQIFEYNISTKIKKNLYTNPYGDAYYLTLSPDKKYLIYYSENGYIYYLYSNGVFIKSINTSCRDLGFLSNGQVFYEYSGNVYLFSNIEYSSTSSQYKSFYDLKVFLPIKNDNYYNVVYDDYDGYQIRQNDYTNFYSKSYSNLTDLAINSAETTLLFIESGNKLQSMNLTTKQVTTLYTISGGYISKPTFNDDGTKIAVSIYSNSNYQSDIYTMDSNGKNMKNITNTPSIDEDYPNWK